MVNISSTSAAAPQHEAKQQGGRLAVQRREEMAGQPETGRQQDAESVAVDVVGADARQHDRHRKHFTQYILSLSCRSARRNHIVRCAYNREYDWSLVLTGVRVIPQLYDKNH